MTGREVDSIGGSLYFAYTHIETRVEGLENAPVNLTVQPDKKVDLIEKT